MGILKHSVEVESTQAEVTKKHTMIYMSSSGYSKLVRTSPKKKSLNCTSPNGDIKILKSVLSNLNRACLNMMGKG
jgi:hypothetical protein